MFSRVAGGRRSGPHRSTVHRDGCVRRTLPLVGAGSGISLRAHRGQRNKAAWRHARRPGRTKVRAMSTRNDGTPRGQEAVQATARRGSSRFNLVNAEPNHLNEVPDALEVAAAGRVVQARVEARRHGNLMGTSWGPHGGLMDTPWRLRSRRHRRPRGSGRSWRPSTLPCLSWSPPPSVSCS